MTPTEKVAILERALCWYANANNYAMDSWGVPSVIKHPEYGAPGKKARLALRRIGVNTNELILLATEREEMSKPLRKALIGRVRI